MISTIYHLFNYFFSPLPGTAFSYYIPVLVLALIGIMLSFFLKFYFKKSQKDKILKKLFKNIPNDILTISLLTLVYLACRWQNIYLFSMRLFIYLLAIWAIYKIYHIIKIYKITYPKLQEMHKKQLTANKYLSKHKK